MVSSSASESKRRPSKETFSTSARESDMETSSAERVPRWPNQGCSPLGAGSQRETAIVFPANLCRIGCSPPDLLCRFGRSCFGRSRFGGSLGRRLTLLHIDRQFEWRLLDCFTDHALFQAPSADASIAR